MAKRDKSTNSPTITRLSDSPIALFEVWIAGRTLRETIIEYRAARELRERHGILVARVGEAGPDGADDTD